jgi:hypothetical protein
VLVAQLDRVSDYESEGRRFEPSRAHHYICGFGGMADALDLGSSVNDVEVQVL